MNTATIDVQSSLFDGLTNVGEEAALSVLLFEPQADGTQRAEV